MRGRDNFVNLNSTGQKDTSQHKPKIEKLYMNEFEDGIATILQDPESVFLNKILNRVKLAVGEYIRKTNCDEKSLADVLKQCDDHMLDKFYQIKKSLLKIFSEFKKSPIPKLTEFLFRRHCKNCPDVPMHNCNNRLMVIKENNEARFVVCTECKVVFFSNSLILFCKACSCDFYSSIVKDSAETDTHPATWENYHCGQFFNEQMRCLKCKDLLFIRNNDGMLFCSKCKFTSDPRKIVWICTFCKTEFQSNAKIFNVIEFKLIKIAIKEALLNKILARPIAVPCCGERASKTTFMHKKTCQGELYSGDLNGKMILVCGKCKSISSLDGFLWTCPLCETKFKGVTKRESRNNCEYMNKEKSNPGLGTPIITPVKSKMSSQVVEKCESEKLPMMSPYVKRSVIVTSKEPEPVIERVAKYAKKREEEKKAMEQPRNRSVYKYKQEDSKFERSDNMRKFTDVVPIKEEESDREKYSNRMLTEDSERTPEKRIEKPSIISKLESKNPIDGKPNTNSKNSNSSNNNNETSDSVQFNKTSSTKMIMPVVPIPNKHRNKLVHMNTINHEDNSGTLEKELLGELVKRNNFNNQKVKNKYSTPEINSKGNEKDKSLNNSNHEDKAKKIISTPGPSNGKSNYNSGRGLDLLININTPSKKDCTSFDENEEEEMGNKTARPLESINIDDFKIINNIGEGSFGVIYSAENVQTKQRFAMKKIIVNNDEDLKLFMSEFELVNRFRHKNILQIYGLCSKVLDFSTKVLYIQMELAISDWDKEIKNRHKTNNFYRENDIVAILKQVVNALSFLQERGISHRDVKPQNILMFPDNMFKVADFGEAKEMKMGNKQLETLRGTELYMSPILFTTLRNTNKNNVQHNSYKSDVFSLGYCLLYAATLSFKILYDLRHVNNQKYANNIIKTYLGKKYSATFIETLCNMVDVNESNRFDFISLRDHLKEVY